VNGDVGIMKLLRAVCLVLWAVIIFLPAVFLFAQAFAADAVPETYHIFASLVRSFGLAAIISGTALVLGYVPGRLLGTCRSGRDLLLLLLLMPLVLPQYVLYYAWALLLTPTTWLGNYFSNRPDLARFAGKFSSCLVLVLWYWPLAALLIAQGWRNIDRQIWDCAELDIGPFKRFRYITLPLLARPLCLAFGVCFVLSLSEFATFHLAGINTIGTELAVLYQLTGSEGCLARAAWPVVVLALIAAVVLGRESRSWGLSVSSLGTVEFESQRWQWAVLIFLVGISLIVPVGLLIYNMKDTQAFRQFLKLHIDELGWSLVIGAAAGAMAYLIALGGLSLATAAKTYGRAGGSNCVRSLYRFSSLVVSTTIFLAMFVPASLVAVSLVKMLAVSYLPSTFRQGWYIVGAGQASRFSGVALILLILARHLHQKQLSEMASVDGASSLGTWWHVHLPQTWPLFVGCFILIMMLSITELSATMVLLPAGLPNFAQSLLNQMHYLGDQQVIASCLVLICLFLILIVLVVLLLRAVWLYRRAALLVLVVCVLGRSGRGQSEFSYPRAIVVTGQGSLFVVDKTGRIQCFTTKGDFLGVIEMPLIETGKPTGISVAPNGDLYVADTHYHRVVVFSVDGKLINEFGRFGKEGGCFIYPTDVAFSGDGRIFVSEYGGNDRVSVFMEKGKFLYCFGTPGSGAGQFARPSALCVDRSRQHLYVADACNHRIAIYSLDCKLIGYIGSAGRDRGQLRYPYDLALLRDGTLVVCEYGNNRLQLFSPSGNSLAVYGRPGRRLGELAYPWAVAVDSRRRAYVVDAGNNRIQVWQL
jgi:ABC-type Fe3+ transport system permease subunit/sugar lactone lactonase YvrE